MSIIEGDDLNVSESNSDSESLNDGLNDQEEWDAYHDTLETENLVLRRNMPRLYDAQGQDITSTFILLQERISDLTLGNQQLEFKYKEKEQKKRSVVKTTRVDGQAQERASNTEVESSSTVDDQSLQLMEHFSGLKKEMLNMFEALQGILPFLEKLVENNSETSSSDKVKKMKKEFYKCLHEISIKIINVEDLEKTLNESLKHQHGHTQTDGNDTRALVRLQNEVDTLRINLKKEVETKDGIKKENASLRAELRSVQDEKMTVQKELMDVTEKFEKLEEEHAVLQEQMENGSQNHETVELLRAKQRIQKLDSKIIATAEENDKLVSMIEKLKKGIDKQEKTYGDSLERIHVELEQMRNALSQNQQKEEKHQLQEIELKMLMEDKADHERRKQQVQVYEKRIREYEKNMVKLVDRSKTLHEDCVKFGNYIQSIVTAAATGKYDKMKRPDNVDESAHAIIMDLLEGTSDEVKKKFEYSLEVLKEIHGKMSKSR